MTRRDTVIYWTGFAIIMALLIVAPLVLPPYWSRFVTEILIWGLLAMSSDVLIGYTGMVSFDHSAFFGLGMYGAAAALLMVSPPNLLLALAFGLIGLFLPKRLTGWWAVLGTAVTLGLAVALLAGFDSGASGLQDTVDVNWIPGLGVDYSLGIDGLNVFLVMLTAVLWTGATAFAAFREQQRPHLFFLMMLLAETATLGSFLAQDLLLFVLFFDLMLVPFYFLFGAWGVDRIAEGGPTAPQATLKMMIYTLIGSLLMLVGAIATAIISAHGGPLTFSIEAIQHQGVPLGSQRWIFWFFAAAFLVKMPAFLVHGWMPDGYRSMPIEVLIGMHDRLVDDEEMRPSVGVFGLGRV